MLFRSVSQSRYANVFKKIVVKLCQKTNLQFVKTFHVSKKVSFQFWINKHDPLSQRIYQNGIQDFEHEQILYLIKKINKKDGFFLDIGSFTGLYSILASRVNPKIKVIAVEPNRAILKNFQKNILLNNATVEIHEKYFSTKRTKKEFFIPETDPTCATLDPCHSALKRIGGKIKKTTVTGSGTRFLIGKKLAGIKIDVEGKEIEALLALKPFLFRHKPFIIVECSNLGNERKIHSIQIS